MLDKNPSFFEILLTNEADTNVSARMKNFDRRHGLTGGVVATIVLRPRGCGHPHAPPIRHDKSDKALVCPGEP